MSTTMASQRRQDRALRRLFRKYHMHDIHGSAIADHDERRQRGLLPNSPFTINTIEHKERLNRLETSQGSLHWKHPLTSSPAYALAYDIPILKLFATEIMMRDPEYKSLHNKASYCDKIIDQAQIILKSQIRRYPRTPLVLTKANRKDMKKTASAFAMVITDLLQDREMMDGSLAVKEEDDGEEEEGAEFEGFFDEMEQTQQDQSFSDHMNQVQQDQDLFDCLSQVKHEEESGGTHNLDTIVERAGSVDSIASSVTLC